MVFCWRQHTTQKNCPMQYSSFPQTCDHLWKAVNNAPLAMEIAILQDIKSITLAATGSTTKRQHTTTNIRLKAMGIAVQYLLYIYIYISTMGTWQVVLFAESLGVYAGSEMPQDTSQLIEKKQTRNWSWKLVWKPEPFLNRTKPNDSNRTPSFMYVRESLSRAKSRARLLSCPSNDCCAMWCE